jgi:hypothetical protein
MIQKLGRRVGGILLVTGALTIAATGTSFAASSPNSVTGCKATQAFSPGSHSFVSLGNPASSAWSWAYNKSAGSAALNVSFGTNSSVGIAISSTQSVEAGIIFAKVAASITEGITYTHTDDVTKTITVTIPGHWYGEAGVSNLYIKGNGTDTITYGNCTSTKVSVTLYEFPTTDPPGYVDNTTKAVPASPPWALAPS